MEDKKQIDWTEDEAIQILLASTELKIKPEFTTEYLSELLDAVISKGMEGSTTPLGISIFVGTALDRMEQFKDG